MLYIYKRGVHTLLPSWFYITIFFEKKQKREQLSKLFFKVLFIQLILFPNKSILMKWADGMNWKDNVLF